MPLAFDSCTHKTSVKNRDSATEYISSSLQITLYRNLLKKKSLELSQQTERLENGLLKLQSTASQVDDLKAKLASQEVELKQKNEDADKLIEKVGVETEKVSKEKAIADEEEKKVQVIAKDVAEKQRSCETDLAKAEPALQAAQEALNTLNKNNLTELKSFGSPPSAVVNVTAAVYVLLSPPSKIPKDRSWKQCKIMMAKVNIWRKGNFLWCIKISDSFKMIVFRCTGKFCTDI